MTLAFTPSVIAASFSVTQRHPFICFFWDRVYFSTSRMRPPVEDHTSTFYSAEPNRVIRGKTPFLIFLKTSVISVISVIHCRNN